MSLTNPNTPVSQQDLQDFYHKLLPYMGGSSGGGGHTIEDSEGTDLTQRDTLQFGEGFVAEDDDTNEKTVISPDVMQSGDMSDVITPLPSVAPKKEGVIYSTTEQVIGEWIDGKPLYQKTIDCGTLPNASEKSVSVSLANVERIVSINAAAQSSNSAYSLPIVHPDALTYHIRLDIRDITTTGFRIFIMDKYNYSGYYAYTTIQYTKTTDTPNT